MDDMKVLGLTSSSEFFIGSKERNFRINEYLVVEDKRQGDLVFEVMEANTYNRYLPLNIGGDLVDSSVIESLQAIGYIVDEETVYIGKCRLLNEAAYPIETGSVVREPSFDEIKSFLINGNLDSSLLLGAIKNTDKVFSQMDRDLQGLYHTYNEEIEKQKDVPFLFNINEMNQYPHIGVFGGSGSGKSYGLRVFIEELMKKNIPTIIFDPHYEMDFQINTNNPSAQRDYSPSYKSFLIGQDVGIDFKDLRAADLKRLLSATSQLSEPMESTIDLLFGHFGRARATDVNTFELLIDDLIEMKKFQSAKEIQSAINNSTGETQEKYSRLLELYVKYDKKTNESTLRGLAWRIRSLVHDGVFTQDSTQVAQALFAGKTAVIQGSTRLLQVYGSYLMSKFYNQRRFHKDKGGDYFPPFVIVTDEAHEFAPKGLPKPSKSIIKEIAQEGRKYGVFLVLATQRPTLLDETVTAQLNSKFIFRTVRATDIQTIREETDISSEEAKRLPYLKTGDLFASIASMGRTIFSRVRLAETTKPNVENPFDELKKMAQEADDRFYKLIEPELPISSSEFLGLLGILEKADLKINASVLEDKLNDLVNKGKLEKEAGIFGDQYKKKN
ncbi:MAG: ATP-binding protein [Bacillota bacterium]|nr:ATP-binding protein [Bacillota bacterium]